MGRPSGKPHPHLAKLRKLVASLPEGVEVEAWQHPTFRAGKRMSAGYGGYQDFPIISIKQTLPDQSAWWKIRASTSRSTWRSKAG